jgi:hypothetical protein
MRTVDRHGIRVDQSGATILPPASIVRARPLARHCQLIAASRNDARG